MTDHAPSRTGRGRRRAAVPTTGTPWRGRGLMALAAVALTGGVVSTGVLGQGAPASVSADVGAVVTLQAAGAEVDLDRAPVLSRSDTREAADPDKQALLDPGRPEAETGEQQLSAGDPRNIARALLGDYGFGADQFGCLDSLWVKESNWNHLAQNPSSGAYGIPQSLPGSKMASVAGDWRTNPVTQIKWGLGYIKARYGSPCSAWGHSQRRGWY